MSLFSQKKVKNHLAVYVYLIAGGISSLLIVFFFRQSWPLNHAQSQNYHRQIQSILRQVIDLEKELVIDNSDTVVARAKIGEKFRVLDTSIGELAELPTFIIEDEQVVFKQLIASTEEQLATKSQLFVELQQSNHLLHDSCSHITNIKQEVVINPRLFGGNITKDSELFNLGLGFVDLISSYCINPEGLLKNILEQKSQEIRDFAEQVEYKESKFIITNLIEHSNNIIATNQSLALTNQQMSFASIVSKIQELESIYLAKYQQRIQTVNNYRLASNFLVLIIVISIAYKIISNLTRTNRSIVKTLESFTCELETKVEERTAQLETSIQNTEAALAQAQNANKAKSRFLANMSHELRTPLNAILGFTQLMTRDVSMSGEQQENLKIINRSGEHLLQLINDILEMSKIEVGQITLNETQFDLYQMLQSIEDMLRLKATAKHLNLIFDIDRNVPQQIYTDEGKLRQIIINLLGNALKFTEQGSVVLKVRLEENDTLPKNNIEFLFSDTSALFFAVEDTGPGIALEEMAQLFTPFEQTTIGRVSQEGTGLGLSICHKFVELMGGELKAESVVGEGSCFFFNVLLRQQRASSIELTDLKEIQSQKVMGLAPKQKSFRILAVDDVPASRLLLTKLLTRVGFQVQEAGDGQQAIELWQSWHPDLILMDIRMPVINGYEATQIIKSQPGGEQTIIIALTASAFEEERVEILSAGCDDFMRKPFHEAELFAQIAQYLNIQYIYETIREEKPVEQPFLGELTVDSLLVMPSQWRSQLYDAAAKVDNQEIFELLAEIPDEYESLAKSLAELAEQFRCDKIIDLVKLDN